MITLSDTAEDMYGKVMSWSDGLIIPGFELCTTVSLFELEGIARDIADGAVNPRDLKMKLAREIVGMYHTVEQAQKAEEAFINTFQKNEIPKDVLQITETRETLLAKIFIANEIVSSGNEFRRLVNEGAITNLDTNEKVTNYSAFAENGVYKIGKKRFCKITLI